MGEEELVIKALEDKLVTSPLVSGASILGDGTVVLDTEYSRSRLASVANSGGGSNGMSRKDSRAGSG